MKNIFYFLILFSLTGFAQTQENTHLKNIKQLTYGGDNAEAYFSFDSKWLTCQVTNPKWNIPCDQIFDFNIKEASTDSTYRPNMVSTGKGRTTCSYYMLGDSLILYASTHLGGEACPPAPAPRKDRKYLWAIYADFDIFVANKQGQIVNQLTSSPGYDAEATVSPDGKKIVFTSTRNGDLDLYVMDIDGKNVKQITFGLGYDGGAFFSPDSKQLVFRSSRPKIGGRNKRV
jgi:TolB protein